MKTKITFTITGLLAVQMLLGAPLNGQEQKTEFPTTPTIVARGPNHQVVEYYTWRTNLNGQAERQHHAYMELGTGINFIAENGQWQSSKSSFEIVDNYAVAFRGPHKLRLAANLNQAGAVSLWLPDNRLLRSHVVAG